MSEPAKPASQTLRLLLVVAIPLVLLVLSCWQIVRGSESVSGIAGDRQALASELVRLETFVARFPTKTVQLGDDPTAYSGSVAVQKLRDASSNAGWYEKAARIRLGAAFAAAGGSALGLLAGLVGLATAAWAQRHSRRSRDAVQAAFSRVRLMLPWILAGQIGGLTLAIGGAGLFEMIGLFMFGELGRLTGGALKIALVLTAAMIGVGWLALRELRRSLRAFTPAPRPTFGRTVTRAEAPGLWRMIDDLAAGQLTAAPDHVVVGLVDGFFVTSWDVDVQPSGEHLRGRTLHLPLPQLAMLDTDETQAVIAHELAHFSGEDTAYSTRFLPIYTAIERNLIALSVLHADNMTRWTQAPAVIFGAHIMAVFDGAVKHWSRVRELEADAASRRPAGPRAAARALIRTALIASVTDRVLEDTSAQPQAAAPDLVEAVVQRAAQDGFPDPQAALSDRQPHPTDTHPPTIARIEALGLAADEHLLSRAGRPVQPEELQQASRLFVDWGALSRDLTADAVAFVTARHDSHKAVLRRMAAERTEAKTPVFQSIRTAIWMAPVSLLFGLMGVFVVYIAMTTHETDLGTLLAGIGCALIGGLAFWQAFGVLRSRRIPYITLTGEGFVCPGLDRMVPWVGVENVKLVEAQIVSFTFHLSATTALPQAHGQTGLFKTARISAKQRTLTVTGKPRGMKPNALLALIGRHMRAAQAHAALHDAPAVATELHAAVPGTPERREPRLDPAGSRPLSTPAQGNEAAASAS